MKTPDFNYVFQCWDAYKQFHVTHGNSYRGKTFVQFDTGEVICIRSILKPNERRYYSELNVRIVGTTDDDMPKLYTKDGGMSSSVEIGRAHV